MGRRISSPELVGRVEEFRLLVRGLVRARRLEAPTLFVSGEAGIGKTRLVQEFARTARGTGARVLTGGCPPLGQSPPPLLPVLEALRAHVRTADPGERTRLVEQVPALASLLPELAAAGLPRSVDDLGLGQEFVFELLLGVLELLSADRSLVLVLEDLHWSDRSTLDLLALRTRTRRAPGCLAVATFRSDELSAGGPLQLLLGELERSGGAERIELQPFGRRELIAQMTGILGARPDHDVAENVVARSDGNPFFAEELLASGSGRGTPLSTLQEVILSRIETLPEQTHAVLRVVSAARRSLAHEALAAVSALPDRDLEHGLREALGQHVLVLTADSAYTFRHVLMQEAVYATLLPTERVRVHREIGRAIEAHRAMSGESDPRLLADIAHHWYCAGDRRRALKAAVEAGLAAERIYAHAEALTQYEHALESWPEVAGAEALAGSDLAALCERAAEAAASSGDAPGAVRLAERAIGELPPTADPSRVGLLHERLGRYRWIAGDGVAAIRAYRDAVHAIPALPPKAARARVLAGLAHVLLISGDPQAARRIAQEALDVARAAADAVEEGRALMILGRSNADRSAVRRARALLEHAGAEPDYVFVTYAFETELCEADGKLETTLEAARAGIAFTGRHGMRRAHQAWLEADAGRMLIQLGRWSEADRILESALLKGPIGGCPDRRGTSDGDPRLTIRL